MLKRDIVDDLYAEAVRRYKEKDPTIEFSDMFADAIWFSIKGVLDHEGEAAAREYVKSAKLIEDVKPL